MMVHKNSTSDDRSTAELIADLDAKWESYLSSYNNIHPSNKSNAAVCHVLVNQTNVSNVVDEYSGVRALACDNNLNSREQQVILELLKLEIMLMDRRIPQLQSRAEPKQSIPLSENKQENSEPVDFRTFEQILSPSELTKEQKTWRLFKWGLPLAISFGVIGLAVGAVIIPIFVVMAAAMISGSAVVVSAGASSSILGIFLIIGALVGAVVGLIGGVYLAFSIVHWCVGPSISIIEEKARSVVVNMKKELGSERFIDLKSDAERKRIEDVDFSDSSGVPGSSPSSL